MNNPAKIESGNINSECVCRLRTPAWHRYLPIIAYGINDPPFYVDPPMITYFGSQDEQENRISTYSFSLKKHETPDECCVCYKERKTYARLPDSNAICRKCIANCHNSIGTDEDENENEDEDEDEIDNGDNSNEYGYGYGC